MKTARQLLILSGLALVIAGCIESWESPEWSVVMELPLMSNSYPIAGLVDDSTFTVSDNLIMFIHTGEIEPLEIQRTININPKDSTFVFQNDSVTQNTFSLDETGVFDNEFGHGKEDIEIEYAVIDECILQFQVFTPTAVDSASIRFDDIYTPEGDQLRITLRADELAGFSQTFQYNLAGHTIGTQNNTDVIVDIGFTLQSWASSPGASQLRIWFEDHMDFTHFRGNVLNKTFALETQTSDIDLDYPDNFFETVEPQDVYLEVTVQNEINFPISIFGDVVATNTETGESRRINFIHEGDAEPYMVFEPATFDNPQIMTFHDSIGYIMGISPDILRIENSYFLVVQQGYTGIAEMVNGSANNDDIAQGDYAGKAPFKFIINNDTLTPDFLDEIQISADNRKNIEEYADSAHFILDVDNQYPIGTWVDFYFATSGDPDILYTENPELYPEVNFFRLPSRYLNVGPGQIVEYNWTREDILFFTQPEVYFGMKFTLDSSEGEVIEFDYDDTIHILGRVNLDTHIHFED